MSIAKQAKRARSDVSANGADSKAKAALFDTNRAKKYLSMDDDDDAVFVLETPSKKPKAGEYDREDAKSAALSIWVALPKTSYVRCVVYRSCGLALLKKLQS